MSSLLPETCSVELERILAESSSDEDDDNEDFQRGHPNTNPGYTIAGAQGTAVKSTGVEDDCRDRYGNNERDDDGGDDDDDDDDEEAGEELSNSGILGEILDGRNCLPAAFYN